MVPPLVSSSFPRKKAGPGQDGSSSGEPPKLNRTPVTKWRTLIGLVLIYMAVALNLDVIWGVFYLYWVIPDLFRGETYFIEPLRQKEHPVLYWAVVLTLLLLSLYVFIYAIFYPTSGGNGW